jgi:hypothetical protein
MTKSTPKFLTTVVAATFAFAASGIVHAQTEGNEVHTPSERTSLSDAVNHSWVAPTQDHTVRVEIGKRGDRQLAEWAMFPRVQM